MDSASPLVGRMGTLVDPSGGGFVLLQVDEPAFEEMESCQMASDDLGVPLLLADGKLLMVACGTKVKILDARQPHRGCRVRILEGEFFGKTAFAPRKHLEVQ